MAIERPLDALNQAKDGAVLVELKNNNTIRGKLIAFDIHLNVVLDDAEELAGGEVKRKLGRTLIRGDTVILIMPTE
ncbi:MAG: small nuclear ribonucleoprotein [Candidatus Altiarchaeota archaeon]|nr:small nuclear ribonucleoprotein [Candidatus Altiarchaeota archaeon]